MVHKDTQIQVNQALRQAVYGVLEYNRLLGHSAEVTAVDFSPDGKLIASASQDNTVKIWKRDGTLLTTLKGHSHEVKGVAFSPDGKLLASVSVDRTIKIWKRDGTLLTTLRGHTAAVKGVAFSPDGKLLASASHDNTVKIWKRDGSLLTTLKGHSHEVEGVAFSPDGKLLASISEDKTLILWDLEQFIDLEQVLASGCDWVRDYLRTNPKLSQSDRALCAREFFTLSWLNLLTGRQR